MYIHNFFEGILRSIRNIFDNRIFKHKKFRSNNEMVNDFIRSYQFNIGNRAFTLAKTDYTTGFEFPACIMTLNSERYYPVERPNVAQGFNIDNINCIRVIVDPLTGREIFLQEEHVEVSIDVQINCETQIQAKEIEYTIKRYLPLEKYIQGFGYTAWIEIDPTYLLYLGMDFNDRQLLNHFVRTNDNFRDSVRHYFSMYYNPLIKLESSSVSISDNSARSFPVNLTILYQIQMPMFISDNLDMKIEKINVDFNRFGYEPISDNNCRTLFTQQNNADITLRNLIVSSKDSMEVVEENNYPDSPIIIGIRFTSDSFKILQTMKFNIMDKYGKMHYDVCPFSVHEEINQVKFKIPRELYFTRFVPDNSNPIIVQFVRRGINI